MPTKNNLKFDDTIQCCFYSCEKYSYKDWENLCASVNDLISNLSKDYLWNRDEFKVCMSLQPNTENNAAHLTSVTCFGDNIEDEWFIVYLLYEITKVHCDLVVYVEDSDGCFLLIEAADYIPDWLHPDNAENRVFIYQNNIHVIYPELISLDEEVDISNAVELISSNKEKTKAQPEVQTAIFKRINGYPQKIQEDIHNCVVSLPLELATILMFKPSLISPIVNAYCNYDIFDAKTCQNMKYQNCIDTQVKFPKLLYAMLLKSKPIKSLFKSCNIISEERKILLGFKLTCGYQIIMNQSEKDVLSSHGYKKFLNSLQKTGYFKENIEGSKEYTELLDKATTYFLNIECPLNTYTCNEILSIKTNEAFLRMKDTLRNGTNNVLMEDNDDWLNITPDQLNELLTKQFKPGATALQTNEISPQNMTSALKEFLNNQSDYEGIEKPLESVDKDTIDFDPDDFKNCIEKYLNMLTLNNNANELNENSECSEDDEISQSIEKELEAKFRFIAKRGENTVRDNLVQSMKEEGLTGPASNVLKTIGFKKTDLLDSDDDE
ncbi:unnamed protein product [Leptosia nina]|uniref:Ecdysoneless n=1 Tax=Leptosia nina TaxID=320188 RepID=A0AAV1K5F0_9NEOP